MLRLAAIATALLVVLDWLAAPVSATQAAPPPARQVGPAITLDAVLGPGAGLSRAAVRERCVVPLDHADPAGPTIRLALTRRLHTASTYQGVMLVNPGGPGGSGLSMAALGDYVPGDAGAAYDWIGFDPRGVGASTPSLHCTRGYFGYDRPELRARRSAWIARYWLAQEPQLRRRVCRHAPPSGRCCRT